MTLAITQRVAYEPKQERVEKKKAISRTKSGEAGQRFCQQNFFNEVSVLFKKQHKWFQSGELSALPFSFQLTKSRTFSLEANKYCQSELCFTKEFFQTKLGKQLAKEEQYYASIFPQDAHDDVRIHVATQFKKGLCWGQVAALVIAQREEKDLSKLLQKIDKTHVLFFQAMSYLRWHYKKKAEALRSKNQSAHPEHFVESRKRELQVFQDLADVTLVKAITFLSDDTFCKDFLIMLSAFKEATIRVTFPHKKDAHTSCVFLGKESFLYDSLLGLVSYKNKDALFEDLRRYCGRIQKSAQESRRGIFIELFQATIRV